MFYFLFLCLFLPCLDCTPVTFGQTGDVAELISDLKRNNARLSILESKVNFLEEENAFLRNQVAEMTTKDRKSTNLSSTSSDYNEKFGLEIREQDKVSGNHKMKDHRPSSRRNIGDPGDVVGSKQTAFTAKTSRNIDPLNNHQTIVFDQELTNIGGAYNHVTGIFQAAVPGTYVFFTNIGGSDHQELWTWIVKDGNRLVDTYTVSHNAAGYHGADSNMVVVHLAEGESVWVETVSDSGHSIAIVQNGSTFSGFLLYPDP